MEGTLRGALLPNRALPPVFPIVLYNGEEHWGAATKVSALLTPVRRSLRKYAPQMKYLLIDEQKCANAELAPPGNLASILFRLENSDTLAEANDAVALLLECLQGPEDAELRRAFSEWIGQVLFERHSGEPLNGVVELREIRTMLADRISKWEAQAREKGLLEGRLEGQLQGRLEGHLDGERQILLRLLRRRFGELSPAATQYVRRAQTEDLECWAERLLGAQSLTDVFGGEVMQAPCES